MYKLTSLYNEIKVINPRNREYLENLWDETLNKSDGLSPENFIIYLTARDKLEQKYRDFISNAIKNVGDEELSELYNDIMKFKKYFNL